MAGTVFFWPVEICSLGTGGRHADRPSVSAGRGSVARCQTEPEAWEEAALQGNDEDGAAAGRSSSPSALCCTGKKCIQEGKTAEEKKREGKTTHLHPGHFYLGHQRLSNIQ